MANSARRIPSPHERNRWLWGFTPQAERWNGRLAMIGLVFIVLEAFSGRGILHFWNLI